MAKVVEPQPRCWYLNLRYVVHRGIREFTSPARGPITFGVKRSNSANPNRIAPPLPPATPAHPQPVSRERSTPLDHLMRHARKLSLLIHTATTRPHPPFGAC